MLQTLASCKIWWRSDFFLLIEVCNILSRLASVRCSADILAMSDLRFSIVTVKFSMSMSMALRRKLISLSIFCGSSNATCKRCSCSSTEFNSSSAFATFFFPSFYIACGAKLYCQKNQTSFTVLYLDQRIQKKIIGSLHVSRVLSYSSIVRWFDRLDCQSFLTFLCTNCNIWMLNLKR